MRHTRQAPPRRQRTIGRCVLLSALVVLAAAASASPGVRRHAPLGLHRDRRHERPQDADRGALRSGRQGLRRGEGRDREGVRRPRRHDAPYGRGPADEGHGLLRPRAARAGAPARHDRGPGDLRRLLPRRPDRRHPARLQRRLPRREPRELRDRRAGLAHRRGHRRRAEAARGLVHAVQQPHDRRAWPSRPTARCTSPAARAPTTTARTGARTACRRTRAATRPRRPAPRSPRRPPRAARCGRRTCGARATRRGSTAPSCASTR